MSLNPEKYEQIEDGEHVISVLHRTFSPERDLPVFSTNALAVINKFFEKHSYKQVYSIIVSQSDMEDCITPAGERHRSTVEYALTVDPEAERLILSDESLVGPAIHGDRYFPLGVGIWQQNNNQHMNDSEEV